MNEINVLEFLKEFNVDIPEKISRGSLFKITYTGDLRSVSFHLKFSELVDFESTLQFENNLRSAFAIERVNILCFYPSDLLFVEN